MLAAACATALMVIAARPALVVPVAPAIRFKGEAALLQTYVRRGAETRVLRSGEALYAGDQLAFKYTLAQPRHCLLLGIDDAGTITRYFPEATLAPVAVLPAGVRTLPIGIELDAHKGQERLVALFSETPLDEQRVRSALSAAFRAARARSAGLEHLGDLDLPARQISVWFHKL